MSPMLDTLREALPEPARDIKLNLQSVLQPGALSEAQVLGVALASAVTAGNPRVIEAMRQLAQDKAGPAMVDDALAAAALMAMNNVYYRFRHMVGKASYGEKPARLRMNRIVKPATTRAEFELICLAVSAINGCEMCIRSHEAAVVEGGLTEDHVHDAVRVAAVVKATAVALEG
jgi:alkyl hydroperoxide reductase subunit D